MKPSLLLVIASDPRTSHRPAEAIRIAAGLGASGQIQLRLYFHDAALLALGKETAALVDEENYEHYLPLLARPEIAAYTHPDNPYVARMGAPRLACQQLHPGELTALARSSSYLLRY